MGTVQGPGLRVQMLLGGSNGENRVLGLGDINLAILGITPLIPFAGFILPGFLCE